MFSGCLTTNSASKIVKEYFISRINRASTYNRLITLSKSKSSGLQDCIFNHGSELVCCNRYLSFSFEDQLILGLPVPVSDVKHETLRRDSLKFTTSTSCIIINEIIVLKTIKERLDLELLQNATM